MEKRWMVAVALALAVGAGAWVYFTSGEKASAAPIAVADIQYPFEKGGGLVHVAVEDIFMGVGMLTGERKKDDLQTPLTGSVNFEMATRKGQARLQVEGIRLVERTAEGEVGRKFEPERVYDDAMEQGLEPELQFPNGKGKLPFVWENGEKECVYFTFKDIPADVTRAELVLTYHGKFPGKKHATYYEDRLSVKRKAYLRN